MMITIDRSIINNIDYMLTNLINHSYSFFISTSSFFISTFINSICLPVLSSLFHSGLPLSPASLAFFFLLEQ